jgi:gamma-glutamyl phosphate reductase
LPWNYAPEPGPSPLPFLTRQVPRQLPTQQLTAADSGTLPAPGTIPSRTLKKDDSNWALEYLDLRMAVRIVDSLDEAISHINRMAAVTPTS